MRHKTQEKFVIQFISLGLGFIFSLIPFVFDGEMIGSRPFWIVFMIISMVINTYLQDDKYKHNIHIV